MKARSVEIKYTETPSVSKGSLTTYTLCKMELNWGPGDPRNGVIGNAFAVSEEELESGYDESTCPKRRAALESIGRMLARVLTERRDPLEAP